MKLSVNTRIQETHLLLLWVSMKLSLTLLKINKTMKRYFIFLFSIIFLCYSCNCTQQSSNQAISKQEPINQENTPRVYVIKYVDMDVETPFTVYFETWDQFFKSMTMKDTISSPLIDELIEYVLLSNDTTSSDPDTRMVIKPMVNENYIISIGRNSTKINKKIVWNNHHLDTLIMEIYSILEPPL